MSSGKRFDVKTHTFPAGQFGSGEVRGNRYEGPYGPLGIALVEERTVTRLRGGEVGEAHLSWGPHAETTTKGWTRLLREEGVEGAVGSTAFRLRRREGWRRPKRLLVVEMPGRPARQLRMRRWKTFSLETPDGTRLVTQNYGWKGTVLPAADAVDVALFLLITTAEMHHHVAMGYVPW